MKRLSINGKNFDLSERDFLNSINDLSKGYYILAEAYHNYHLSGFADLKNTFQMSDVGQKKLINVMVEQIDDGELLKTFNYMEEQLQEMKQVDIQIIEWLAEFLEFPLVQSKKDKAYLEKRLKKIISNGSKGQVQGPVWALEPQYKEFLEKSEKIMISIKDSLQKIELRILTLLESSEET